MRLLLDTHFVIDGMKERNGPAFRRWMSKTAGRADSVAISIVSVWEIAIKTRIGRLDIQMPVEDVVPFFETVGANVVGISLAHVTHELVPRPPTRDPFDHLLLSQCAVEERRLLTRDRALSDHPLAALVSE